MISRATVRLPHKHGIGIFTPPLQFYDVAFDFICRFYAASRRGVSNSYAVRIHMGERALVVGEQPSMGLALSMNAMTYAEEFRGMGAGPKLSPGPPASYLLPKFESFAVMPFLRPGPEVVNESIPVFFVGRNRDGLWVARDAKGKRGGIFWRKQSALRFANRSAGPTGCALVFPQARFELDIENAGNPVVAHLGPLLHLATRPRQRTAAFIGKMTQAVMRRLKDFRVPLH
jgi:hypothetical protein